jgi:hypothetical protein
MNLATIRETIKEMKIHPGQYNITIYNRARRRPQRCARRPVGTHPHLLVVGIGNPIAVHGLARSTGRARRGEPTTAIRTITSCRESRERRAFKNNSCTLPAPRSPARPFRDVFSRPDITKIPSQSGGWGMCLHEPVEARRVRTDQRWGTDVGAGGGQTGSTTRVWCSLDVDQPSRRRAGRKGGNTTLAARRTIATGGEARSGWGDPHD